jgi:hypothetical protein
MTLSRPILALCLAIAATSCSTVYYGAMEKLGKHKREILVDRVSSARDAQGEAKEQFKDALDQFSKTLGFHGGDLQQKYETLNAEYLACESRAKAVNDRVDAVDNVSKALFREWKAELDQYESAELRRSSERQLSDTKARYGQLIAAMRRAEKGMDPVLKAFRDQVLFLKHNLNARAISSLQGELRSVEGDIAVLIRDMERSIREADQFIRTMGNEAR